MSDDIIYTSIDISNSNKRKRTDEFVESSISHLSISSDARWLDGLDESLTRIEIHQQTGNC